MESQNQFKEEQEAKASESEPAFGMMPLLVVAVLAGLSVVTLLVAPHKPPRRTARTAPVLTTAPTPPQRIAVLPAQPKPVAQTKTPPKPKPPQVMKKPVPATPLTISLRATNSGGHIKVGTGVTFTAIATTGPGQSANMTLFYRLNQGKQTVFSFVQGNLSSTTWTAPAPGKYHFTALALSDRKQAATSKSVEITVDHPPATPQLAAKPPQTAKLPVPARPLGPLVYHAVAARFGVAKNADTLANVLRRSGGHPTVLPMADSQGNHVYIVETGTYHSSAEVFKAVAVLMHSGYPSYFYTSR